MSENKYRSFALQILGCSSNSCKHRKKIVPNDFCGVALLILVYTNVVY